MSNGSPARDESSGRVGTASGQLRSAPDCCMNQRSVIPAKAGIHRLLCKFPAFTSLRASPMALCMIEVDSRFRGNDSLKKTISACGLPSLVVNLSHTLLRSENHVCCAANALWVEMLCN